MTTSLQNDRPDVMVFPPLILIATLALSAVLQKVVPLALLSGLDRSWRLAVGVLMLATGVGLSIAGAQALRRIGTNVNPLRPTLKLATNGIYRWTRNPMYDGGLPLMIGLALIFGLDWLPLLLVPSYLVLHVAVIRREEQYLERKFGEAYRRYRARVPRHLFPQWRIQHQET
jgi:protein-S-isoprenylcysteine O-methyltransferase Ste14